MKKQGVSTMIAYVILILIAISLSFGVFISLKNWVPEEKEECPSEVSLIIKEVECLRSSNQIKIEFENKGRFNIDGAYLLIGNSSSPRDAIYEVNATTRSVPNNPGFFYFIGPYGLRTGSTQKARFHYNYVFVNDVKKSNDGGVEVIEIKPFIKSEDDGKIILCSESNFKKTNIGCS